MGSHLGNIKKILGEHNIRPNKLMGQHFLIDENVLAEIIRSSSIRAEDTILEIGPGLGALTFELAKRASRVIAVEKDEKLYRWLKEEIRKRGAGNIELIRGDILKLSEDLFARMSPYKVVANIPYYLTARLLRKLLTGVSSPAEIILTVQKEVAERIIAKPPHMNLLALAVQAYGAPSVIFPISRESFWPPPEVDSALLAIKNISKSRFRKYKVGESAFFQIARTAFGQKRKQLARVLTKHFSCERSALENMLEQIGLKPAARSQELSLEQWLHLTQLSKKQGIL